MKLHFTKMQGCGNDYIYVNGFEQEVKDPVALSQAISHRHFGVGGDGLVLICPSEVADARMRMFNADGSEGKMCGNAIRCVGKYLYDRKMVEKKALTIETLSGLKTLELFLKGDKVDAARVNMGKAEFSPGKIPVALPGEAVLDYPLEVGGRSWRVSCVSMGNPHCVIFGGDPEGLDLPKIGPLFEKNPLFPQGVNTEFVEFLDQNTLKMRVWERGSGETWACGTGACAVVSAAVRNGLCREGEEVTVLLRGGELVIRYTEAAVFMTGKAVWVFDGEWEEADD